MLSIIPNLMNPYNVMYNTSVTLQHYISLITLLRSNVFPDVQGERNGISNKIKANMILAQYDV